MSTLLLSPMTELEAVNRILSSIGQSPVNTLTVTGVPDVVDALSALRETSRDVQAEGWSWNTDTNYSLTPQTNGYIAVPEGALEVDPDDKTVNIVVRREPNTNTLCLYDADNLTFKFTTAVTCRIVWGFPFEDLPQAARTYITVSAGRLFQSTRVSSPVLEKFDADAEQRAWYLLWRIERRSRDTNSFRGRADASKALRRRF